MEESKNPKDEISVTYRRYACELMVKKLKDWNKVTTIDELSKLQSKALKFELEAFNQAISKDDYKAKVQEKMDFERQRLIQELARLKSQENEYMVNSFFQQNQNSFNASESSILTNLPQSPAALQSHNQDTVLELLNVEFSQNDNYYPLMQENSQMQETFPTLEGVLSAQFNQCSSSVTSDVSVQELLGNEFYNSSVMEQNLSSIVDNNGPQFQMTCMNVEDGLLNTQGEQQSSPVTSNPVSQVQLGNNFHESRAIEPQNKDVPQSETAYIRPDGPLLDAAAAYEAERKLIMDMYYDARKMHLPRIYVMAKKAEKSSDMSEKAKFYRVRFRQMINFLLCGENILKSFSNETMRQNLICINQMIDVVVRNLKCAQDQASQCSNAQIYGNYLQNTPVQNTTISITDMISTSTIERLLPDSLMNLPNAQFNASYSPIYGTSDAPKWVDMPIMMNNGRHVNEGQINAIHSLNQYSEPMTSSGICQPPKMLQSEKPQKGTKRKDVKRTSKNAQGKSSRVGRPSTKPRVVQTTTTSHNSCPRPISHQNPSVVTLDTSSTLMTPYKETGKPTNFGVMTTVNGVTEEQDSRVGYGTNRSSLSSMKLSSYDQSKQLPKSEVLPFEKLVKAIESIPSEVIDCAINDISSAFIDVDELPVFTWQAESKSSVDDDLIELPQEMYYATGDEHMPSKRLKHNFDSMNNGALAPFNNRDFYVERPRIAANYHRVVAEVVGVNQNLIETWVEVASSPDSDTSQGTIVRCIYMPIAFDDALKRRFATIVSLSILTIEFLVPPGYPEFSPVILDSKLPYYCGPEGEDTLRKARTMFERSIRGLVSIEEMVKTWDACARVIFSKLAARFGEETFNNRYDGWMIPPAK